MVVPLPESAVVGNGSSCGDSPALQASFGDGHSLDLVFSSDGHIYRVANLNLTYNLSDNATFPGSSSKGTKHQTLPSVMQDHSTAFCAIIVSNKVRFVSGREFREFMISTFLRGLKTECLGVPVLHL